MNNLEAIFSFLCLLLYKNIWIRIHVIIRIYNNNDDIIAIKIYVNKVENRITFKIKTGCYIEILTPEMMKLLGSTKSKDEKICKNN